VCAKYKSSKLCKTLDKNEGKNEGWAGALKDAENQLEKAKAELSGWQRTVEHCRESLAKGRPWPGMQSEGHDLSQQHSV